MPTISVDIADGFHQAVRRFKRALLIEALWTAKGNRTIAAKQLRLPRTYLLRLMRDLKVREQVPAGPTGGRSRSTTSVA